MQMKAAVCSTCGGNHYATFCYKTPHKPLKQATKPINKVGKVTKKTNAAVSQWKRKQKPNHQGYWICYICGKWIDYLEAEHAQSKVRHPELRADQNNLKPVCSDCNEKKGSKDLTLA
jgi:hypothetical protein